MDILQYEAAKWLIEYKTLKHKLPSRQLLETIREFTYDNRIHKHWSADKSAIFRGVQLERSAGWLMDRLVNDTPISLKTKPYESWSVDYEIAQNFAVDDHLVDTFDVLYIGIVLFRKKPKPGSIVANMIAQDWWEEYLSLEEIEDDPQFSKIPGEIRENLESFREAELLVDPQCNKCEFKKNVAWIVAPLSFWMEYSERTGTALLDFYPRGDNQRAEHVGRGIEDLVFYFGSYQPTSKVVELFWDDSKAGVVEDNSKFEKFVRMRVGPTVQSPF